MNLMTMRLLDHATLSPGETGDTTRALDCGAFREVHLVLTVHSAGVGDTPKLCVKHAAQNESGAYLDFDTAAEIALTGTGMAWFKADAFTRYLCWFVSGTLNTEAVVSLDLVAKS